jgi:predicted DNA-binding transcriptional regulator AlpA
MRANQEPHCTNQAPNGKAEDLKRQIANVKDSPDWAAVTIKVVMALTNRSRASVYRDVAAGRLPKWFKQGASTRWRVGDLRRTLEQA